MCKVCPSGWQISGVLGSRKCARCVSGKISTSGGICTNCTAGSYADSGKTVCVLCERGKWSSVVGANDVSTCQNCSSGRYSSATGVSEESGCNRCGAGRFSSEEGATTACTSCPGGFYQDETSAKSCKLKSNGTIVLGGAAFVDVPKGSYIGCDGTCFSSCLAGTYGSDPPTDRCFDCPAGWSSSCLLYTSPSPRDRQKSRMPSSA